MKTELFLLLLALFLILIGVLGLFLYAQSEKVKRNKAGKIIIKITAVLLLTNLYLLKESGREDYFSIHTCQEYWSRHQLPQIDSTMPLVDFSLKSDYYLSWSNDSIKHHSKTVHYDIFDIYSIEDNFANRKTNQFLTITYVQHNLLRDSSRIYTIRKWSSGMNEKPDTISKAQFDSTIENWGMSDKIYKRFEYR